MKRFLTDKQIEVFNIIKDFINENGYSPTIREIGKLSSRKSPSTIHSYLMILEEKGYITYKNGKSRTIKIVGEVEK